MGDTHLSSSSMAARPQEATDAHLCNVGDSMLTQSVRVARRHLGEKCVIFADAGLVGQRGGQLAALSPRRWVPERVLREGSFCSVAIGAFLGPGRAIDGRRARGSSPSVPRAARRLAVYVGREELCWAARWF